MKGIQRNILHIPKIAGFNLADGPGNICNSILAEHIAVEFAKVFFQHKLLFFGTVHDEENSLIRCRVLIDFLEFDHLFDYKEKPKH